MSWTDEEIDALFKEASTHSRVPEYDDSFFDEVEKLLPRKKSKKGFYITFSVSVLLLVSFVILMNSYSNKTKNQLASDIKIEQQPQQKMSFSDKIHSELVDREEKKLALSKKTKKSSDYSSSIYTLNSPERIGIGQTFAGSFSNIGQDISSLEKERELASQQPFLTQVLEKELTSNGSGNSTLSFLPIGNFFSPFEKEIQVLNLPQRNKRHILTIELANGFSENFASDVQNTYRPMFVTSLGINYHYRVRTFLYNTGLNWINYRPDHLNLTRESKVYGFVTNKYNQNIDYKLLSAIEIPLSISKQHHNHLFTVGVSPVIMLGSVIRFTKQKDGEIIENSTIYGNMLGLKRFGLSSQISYALRISPTWDLGIKLSNQLISLLDQSRFADQINKTPFQAQFTITKHFGLK